MGCTLTRRGKVYLPNSEVLEAGRLKVGQVFVTHLDALGAERFGDFLQVNRVPEHEYYQVGDLLTDTLLQAVQTHRNAAQRETQERVYRQQQDTAGQLRQLLDGVVTHATSLAQLEQLAFSFDRTNDEKVAALLRWLHLLRVLQQPRPFL